MIEVMIQNRLASLAGGRVYAGTAPSPVTRPYITHFDVGGPAGMTFCGPDNSYSTGYQIDCWADSRLAALQLGWQVFHQLKAQDSEFAASELRRLPSAYEPDTKLYRVSWEVAVTTEVPTT